jgi:phosphoribosylformimino-5-aminoimidazole carboxamide ribotide isomerase
MEIIPAIDLINGACVRLEQGDFNRQTNYSSNPLDVAKQFEDAGIKRLHVVDLEGAKNGEPRHLHILEQISRHTTLKVDFGGGVRSLEHMQTIIDAGAIMVSIGSLAIKNRSLMLQAFERYGTDCFFIGADVRDEYLTASGWMEKSTLHIDTFVADYHALGVQHFFCTDVAMDGMLQGPSIALYQRLIQDFPDVQWVASGGVATVKDLEMLRKIGCSGAIVGKAIYENRITENELKSFIYAS